MFFECAGGKRICTVYEYSQLNSWFDLNRNDTDNTFPALLFPVKDSDGTTET
jgi:hypothetical protein